MKKSLILLLFALTACATPGKILPDNRQAVTNHSSPIKIFGIGHYSSNTLILTLVDSKDQYFTIETPADTTLRVGNIYYASTNTH